MYLLKDDEIEALVKSATAPILSDYVAPKDWIGKDSLVQPASLDLHVGDILVPGASPGKRGSTSKPHKSHVLDTGETVVVVTREKLALPANIGAFGFPPTRISNRAVLMTNPGHIDPGYKGPLRLTLINMGRQPYEIRRDDVIVTILLARLSNDAVADYAKRNPHGESAESVDENLERLANDFLNVTQRAKAIANDAVLKAGVLGAIIAGAFTLVAYLFVPSWKDPVNDLKTRVEVLSSNQDAQILSARLERFERVFCKSLTQIQKGEAMKTGLCT